jgi:hypothetical protein
MGTYILRKLPVVIAIIQQSFASNKEANTMTVNDLPKRLRDIPGIVITGTDPAPTIFIKDPDMKVLEQINLPLLERKEQPA